MVRSLAERYPRTPGQIRPATQAICRMLISGRFTAKRTFFVIIPLTPRGVHRLRPLAASRVGSPTFFTLGQPFTIRATHHICTRILFIS